MLLLYSSYKKYSLTENISFSNLEEYTLNSNRYFHDTINDLRENGNFVWIYHYPNYYTIYAHLSDILVNNQQMVREGDFIGLAGSTGLIDDKEARLLLEVLNGKNPENPISWLEPAKQRARI